MSNPSPSPGSRPLEQLKVAELRDELRKRGLSLKGVKKDLFERLDEAVRKEEADAPLGEPEVVENQHKGVQGGYQLEGEHEIAHPGGLSHYFNTSETAQDGDSMSFLNDGENCLQDTTLIVNNVLPYVGASDATPVLMEPHRVVEKLNTGYVINEESIDDVAVDSINNVSAGALPESGNVDYKVVSQPDNSVHNAVSPEPDNQAVGNTAVLPESDNQAIVLEPGDQASGNDIVLSKPGNSAGGNDVVLPEPVGQAGGNDDISVVPGHGNTNDTVVAEPMDGTSSRYSHAAGGNDVLVGENVASVQKSCSAEATSTSEVVIPSEGDKDVHIATVSDDLLAVVETTSDNVVFETVKDAEVFESTILTGVSVVPCVQEYVEERDGGGLRIQTSEVWKDNVLIEGTEQLELQGGGVAVIPTLAPEIPQGVTVLEAVQPPVLPEVHQDIVMPESLQDTILQEVAHDSVIQELPQDIEMLDNQESALVKIESSEDTKPCAAIMDAMDVFVDLKSENPGQLNVIDSRKSNEAIRGGLVDEEKLDVKLEPMEAESRAGRRSVPIENVKVERQDIKEDLPKSGRSFDRSRPKESDYERSRHDPLKYGDERKRAEMRTGRVFKEDGRKDARERDLKLTEESTYVRSSQKRKDDDRDAKQQEPAKRMRRWNSGKQLVVETAKPLTTGTVKEIMSPEIKKGGFTVVPPKLTPKSPGPSRPILPAANADSEANGDKRAVPPTTRAPTASLKIERFVRPFTLKAVKDLLSEFGDCVDFWMDQIKTHCYVTYSKVDEAVAARNGLYDKQWPSSFGNLLVADFVDSSEVEMRSDGSFEKLNAPPATTPRGIPNQAPAQGAQPPGPFHGQSNALASAPPLRERQLVQVPMKDPEPAVPTLDDLFRKTKAKPHIYYLPLTDEQVAEKLATVKNKEQQQVRGRPLGRV